MMLKMQSCCSALAVLATFAPQASANDNGLGLTCALFFVALPLRADCGGRPCVRCAVD